MKCKIKQGRAILQESKSEWPGTVPVYVIHKLRRPIQYLKWKMAL